MSKVISKESFYRANNRSLRKNNSSFDIDSHYISMKFETIFGAKKIVVSKSQIFSAASDALREISRK
jgi:hypothetical protein